MKKLLILLFIGFYAHSFSQGVLNASWYLTKDGPFSQGDVAWGIDVDSLGNIYWATSQKVSPANEKDIYTYKISPGGNEIYSSPHIFGATEEQQAYNAFLKNNILYVAGRTWTAPGLIYSNALVYALDTQTKDTLWSWEWDGGSGYEEVDGLVVENDGIYVSGWTEDSVDKYNLFVAKIDLNGNTVWNTIWGSGNYDTADGHLIVDDSTLYVSGMYNSIAFIFSGEAMLITFDKTTGNYKWHQTWGGNGQEDGMGMNTDGSFLYQCGVTNSFGDSLVFINKWDKNGNLKWTALTHLAIKTRSLDFDSNGDLYLAATTNTLGAGAEDLIIMKYDTANGNLISYRTWGGTQNESVQDIKIYRDTMYLTGRTVSYSPNIYDDALLIKAPVFTAVDIPENANENEFVIYPNPSGNYFFLSGEEDRPVNYSVYDIAGRLVHRENNISLPVIVNCPDWKNGIYILSVNNRTYYQVMITK